MEIVGHAALEMTMNVYGRVALDDQRAALDRLNALLVEGLTAASDRIGTSASRSTAAVRAKLAG